MVSEKKKHKDYDSWYYGGVKRRDFRASHDGPEKTGPPRKKKTRMCKRNGGNKHVVRYERVRSWFSSIRCIHCGKQFFGVKIPNKFVEWESATAMLDYQDRPRRSWLDGFADSLDIDF